jgi:hypothetical protein
MKRLDFGWVGLARRDDHFGSRQNVVREPGRPVGHHRVTIPVEIKQMTRTGVMEEVVRFVGDDPMRKPGPAPDFVQGGQDRSNVAIFSSDGRCDRSITTLRSGYRSARRRSRGVGCVVRYRLHQPCQCDHRLLTLLPVEKWRLHALVKRIDDTDLRSGVRFAVMALVNLPLLPQGPYGPLGGIRPRPAEQHVAETTVEPRLPRCVIVPGIDPITVLRE